MKRKPTRQPVNKIQVKSKAKMVDISAMGPEPALQGANFDPVRINMMRAYNWYNYYYEAKDVRKWVVDYMKLADKVFSKKDIQNFSKVENKNVPLWLCVNARMLMEGCPMPVGTTFKTHARILEEISKVAVAEKVVANNVVPLREYPLLATLDEILDEFYNKNYKFFNPEIYDMLREKGYKPNDAMVAYRYYSEILLDLFEHPEGRENLKATARNNYVRFLETILADLKLYATNEKTARKARKPRARKVKSVAQVVGKAKFQAEFKPLKLVSIHPEKLVGMKAVWLYNSKYKKLTHLVAAEGKTLSIKGTTIINFDEEKSTFKRLRKPEIVAEFIKGTTAKMNREFKAIKTKASPANGRLNAETLILKVVK